MSRLREARGQVYRQAPLFIAVVRAALTDDARWLAAVIRTATVSKVNMITIQIRKGSPRT